MANQTSISHRTDEARRTYWFYRANHLMDFLEFLEDHVENLDELRQQFEEQEIDES